MNPALILFGIRSIIRLGRAGGEAYAQHARDREALFPAARAAGLEPVDYVTGFFVGSQERHDLVLGANAPHREFWDAANDAPLDSGPATEMLELLALQIQAEEAEISREASQAHAERIVGEILIEQWAKGAGPVSPFARVALTIADIALEYVGANPTILGVGSDGEKLLGAFALNLSGMLPDDGTYGGKEQFAQRLVGIFLHSGLKTLSENKALLIPQDHLQELLDNTLPPIIAELPDDISGQIQFRSVLDAVMGPAASATMETIAAHPAAFLGSDFSTEKAIGALTQALLSEAAEIGIADQFSRDGLIGLYRAALGVAAEQPKLFLSDGGGAEMAVARDLFANMSNVLRNAPIPFNGDLGVELGIAALDAVKDNAGLFIDRDDPWQVMAANLVDQVIAGLQQGADAIFSKTQLLEFGRIFLNQAAATPGMIAGDSEELKEIISAVTAAMAAEEALLLTSDDWLTIARVAAIEAAANPARLFHLDGNTAGEKIATELIRTLLGVAQTGLDEIGRADGAVLLGATLRDVILIALESTSGRPAIAKEKISDIESLARGISEIVGNDIEQFGGDEWILLFEHFLAGLISGQSFADMDLTAAGAQAVLAQLNN